MIAGADVLYVVAHRFDHARALMPAHDRKWVFRRPRYHVIVAVADSAGAEPEQHFALARLVQGQRFDGERRIGLV
jgi:hypothetical protein